MWIVPVAFAVLWASAPAQDRSPPSEPSQLPEILVEGRVIEELARDFIGEIGAAPRGVSVARWNRPVCVGVVNLRPETAQFVIDRVSSVATDLGLETGEPGCSPEVIIVATNDGNAVAAGLVERQRRTLIPGGAFTRSRGALATFVESERAVRWWHLSAPVDPDTGRSVANLPGRGKYPPPTTGISADIPTISLSPSLLTTSTREDLLRAIVIVDFSRVGDVDFDQLADYIAFVSLAQVDPEADTANFPTILNVFDDPAATSRLTDWDRAYLQGLYRSDDTAPNSSAREGAIRREMLRARPTGEPGPRG